MGTVAIPADLAAFDEGEFVALIPRMRSFARHLCRNAADAEDLTQAALARAWRRRDSYIAGSNMKAWLLTIVRNQFYSDKRRSWRITYLDPQLAEDTLVAHTNPAAPLELDDVRRGMLELSEEQRRALNLITVAGLPYHEAAQICDCALGTIKSRVSRARQTLGALLAEGDLKAERGEASLAMASIIAESELTRLPNGARERADSGLQMAA